MALSERDRAIVLDALDRVDDVTAKIIVASLPTFASWLERTLPTVYRKVAHGIQQVWDWLRSFF